MNNKNTQEKDENNNKNKKSKDYNYWRVKYSSFYYCHDLENYIIQNKRYGTESPSLPISFATELYWSCLARSLRLGAGRCMPSSLWVDAVIKGKETVTRFDQNQLEQCLHQESDSLGWLQGSYLKAIQDSDSIRHYCNQAKFFSNTSNRIKDEDDEATIISKYTKALGLCRNEINNLNDCKSRASKDNPNLSEEDLDRFCFPSLQKRQMCETSILASLPLYTCMRSMAENENPDRPISDNRHFVSCLQFDPDVALMRRQFQVTSQLKQGAIQRFEEKLLGGSFVAFAQQAIQSDKMFPVNKANDQQVTQKIDSLSKTECAKANFEARSCLQSRQTPQGCQTEFKVLGSCLTAYLCAQPLRYCIEREGEPLDECMSGSAPVRSCIEKVMKTEG
eukprot:gb/GECH01003799.1/.p1 GENE.gb/GECH01003799.1/~~gb/GECH01003799.1/.p1  ORF type:complete len:392 (+),score=71.26 gb/GECH01003799.1/:1-1176(+)